MLLRLIVPSCVLLPLSVPAFAATPAPMHWSGSVFASTSTVINGQVTPKPQYGFELSGRKGALSLDARIATVDSWVGADSENRFTAAYQQSLKPFNLRYQVQYKLYPGTRDGFTDHGLIYQLTASRALGKTNVSLGADYSDRDYATIRKSYGVNLSLSRGFLPKLSGWLSVSHHHQFNSADYTNTNIGLYYQATPKIGVSTSLNDYHAYASWGAWHPTLSVSLSRRM